MAFACNQNHGKFSKEDLETQEAFIKLVDLTYNNIDKQRLIDAIKTLTLPPKEEVIRSYEEGGYVNKQITLSEEDRRIRFYHDVIELGRVAPTDCFLPAVDHNFSVEDFIYNIEYCIKDVFPKIEKELLVKFPKESTISSQMFTELNNLLSSYGIEMGMVNFYDDQFYFIFYDVKRKKKVYETYDLLGIQIAQNESSFRGYMRQN
ncbi:hypothetical protein GCM10022258_40160 [Aquimarina gracilis]